MGSPENRTRVLWLTKGLGPGGMERLLVNHARFGDRDRFDYQAAYLVERPNSVVPELEAMGVRCVGLGGGTGAGLRWLTRLRSLVRDEGIDIVHSHSPLPAAVSRPLLRVGSQRPRLVYTEHNTWDCYGRLTRLANLVTYPLDDAQFAVSADAASSPPPRLRRRVGVLTHGIDLDAVRSVAAERDAARAELGVGAGTTVVVSIAHLRREKGHDVLLEAARRVLHRRDDVVFLVVGHGPLADDLAAHRDRLRLGEGFRFLGFRPDALRLLAASDVFVLASRQEGLPVAFMEAMALGRPAVVTRVGGLPDVVDGTNGILVEPERPDLLATGLEQLAQDRELRERLGAAAAHTAARFDARVAVRRQEALYAELVS